jgi:FkbM family methyltransferase
MNKHIKKLFNEVKYSFTNKCKISHDLNNLLDKDKLIILDVGASGNFKANKFNTFFTKLSNIIIYKFDDEKLIVSNLKQDKIFNKMLWSEKKIKVFYETQNKVSSSFFKPNKKILSDFLNYSAHKIINKKEYEVDKIDSIEELKSINFLKVDIEGSELKILKGAENKLDNLLGLEVEQQFIERYENSPNYLEISSYLINKNFELYFINTESWIKSNNDSNVESNYKVVWGDFIYFLTYDKVKEKIIKSENSENIIFKYISLLLLYNFHDESSFFIKKLLNEGVINKQLFEKYNKFIKINTSSNYKIFLISLTRLFFSIIVLFAGIISWKYKKQAIDYFKLSFRSFFYKISNLTNRVGLNNSIIHEMKL